jgi:hypothetical protein
MKIVREKLKDNKGFIALVLTLSMSGILLALVTASSINSASFFDQALHKKYRAMNYYYAYNCIDQAILDLAHDYFLILNEARELSEHHCSILSIKKENGIHTISTRGDWKSAYVYREARVKVGDAGVEILEIK